MPNEPYQPIACSQYDLFEIAIMRGETLELQWLDEHGVEHCERVKPVGLQTQAGEEFLIIQCNATDRVNWVRLDKIRFTK